MADLARDQLVDRDAGADVGGALLEPDAGEKRAVAARVIAGTVGPALGRPVVQARPAPGPSCLIGSSGWSVRLSAKSAPSSLGHQAEGIAPLGKKMNAERSGRPVASSPVRPAPRPRRPAAGTAPAT